VCHAGARPVFVDVLADTLLIDPEAVSAAVTPATAAVMAVHLFGQMVDADALRAVADRHGLGVIEDAAQAHGARFAGRRAGAVGAAAGFSFYPGKNLGALGDGGAVVTDDAGLADRVRRLADHGRAHEDRRRHDLRGRNSRLDSVQAGVLSAKLARLDESNASRVRAMARYRARLPDGCVPLAEHPASEAVHHLAVVQVGDRDRVGAALSADGIGWAVHYPVPCHLQPAYAEFSTGPLPVAERAARRIMSLPMSPTITDAEVDAVCDRLQDALA
jgi:dTDP-4-amino-4,6-dideoxygalactose transaminase